MGMMIATNDKATMSNELNSMYIRKPMTLQQLRFFTIYLAKINPDNPEDKIVRFKVSDFADLMQVEVNEKAVKENILSLLEHTVWVKSQKYKDGITACHLFRNCEMWKDEETDELMLEFQCSDEIEPYLFKLKKNFTTYEVWNTLRLKSVIHSRMYQLLKQFQKIGERIILIDDLKEQLGIEKDAYPEYKVFARDVLKKCQVALKEKTDIYFEYKSIGRPAKSVKFTIHKNENYDKQMILDEIGVNTTGEDNQENFTDPADFERYMRDCGIESEQSEQNEIIESKFELWSEACRNEFNRTQLEELTLLAEAHVEYDPADPERHDLDLYRYLQLKYKSLQNKQGIKSRFGYMKYLVENDV